MLKRHFPLFCFFSVLVLAVLACNFPLRNQASLDPDGAQRVAFRLATVDPFATPTPTPFQPVPVTPTYIPTNMPPTSTPTPTQTALPTQAPTASELDMPSGQINILLEGSDFRVGSGFRTDVMVLALINPKKGTVTLVSFPRDLYVYIYGWQDNRLNTAQQFGFSTTQATFLHNFGIRVDHYILTNFAGFKSIVDSLGGISVEASQNLTDKCDLPQAHGGWCSVGPGTVTMDGDTALWYARSRHSTSDIDRLRRAQEILVALFRKLMSLDAITKAPQLYEQYRTLVETDMDLKDMLPLLPLATKLGDDSNFRHFAIGYGQVYNWTTPDGAQVLVPNMAAVQALLNQALYP